MEKSKKRLKELEQFGSEIVKLIMFAGPSNFLSKREVEDLVKDYGIKMVNEMEVKNNGI